MSLACIFLMSVLSGCDDSSAQTASSTPATSATASSTTSTPPAKSAAVTATAPATTAATVPPAAVTAAITPATSSLVTNTNSGDACLASTMPSTDALFAAQKKVFAHYFYPFPVSIDNVAAPVDYYNRNYLNPKGEASKWLHEGGYLRARPLGTTPNSNSDWELMNMEQEVRQAIARGITGFNYDSMSLTDATESNGPLQHLLAAAHAVDSRFKIVVMPDLAALKSNASAVVQIIESVASSPAAYRLSDGRLVVSAFDAGVNSPAWWESVLNELAAKGIKVAFVPTFLGWQNFADKFASITYGFGDWGTATAPAASAMQADPKIVHETYGKIFEMPVDPQQFRPKNFVFEEAGNSAAFRNAWTSAIEGDTDWVQLVTWGDYSESSQLAPYTDTTLKGDIGTGFYDLNGFYAAWFATGTQPKITHDVLYYFYRREPTDAAAPAQSQKDTTNGTPAENDVELVAFLTEPGLLKITIGSTTYTQNAPAGITSFKVKSQPGVPLFTLSRSGADVFSFQGGVQIYGPSGLPSGVQDLTYWSGSAAKSGVCSL
jgi:Glycosyl hydrolase family 71